MSVTVAQWLVMLFQLYAAIGIVFAVVFVWRGVGRIDPVAADGTLGFKLLILPGCAAFWPLLLRRWLNGTTAPPDEQNDHRRAAQALSGGKAPKAQALSGGKAPKAQALSGGKAPKAQATSGDGR